MITEIGHFSLVLALLQALAQASVPLVGAARRNLGWMEVGRSCALMQFVLIGLAMLALSAYTGLSAVMMLGHMMS